MGSSQTYLKPFQSWKVSFKHRSYFHKLVDAALVFLSTAQMLDICRIQQAFLDAVKHIEGAESLELKTNQDVQCANGKLYSVWFDSAEAR